MTGKDYIELLEKKNFKLDNIIFDAYCENNKIQELYIYKTYSSRNNDKVSAEIILICVDLCSFNENIMCDEDDLLEARIEDKKKLDKKINYDWFDCVSVNVYGKVNIIESSNVINFANDRGIGLLNINYYQYANPFYKLSLENLEQVLYIQDCQDKTPHINFLLKNYIYYCDKVIDPIIKPIMESLLTSIKCNINLIIGDIGLENNEIRLDFIKRRENFDEIIFSVYIDFLYGNLYGVIETEIQSEIGILERKEYINLNEITKEKLLKELKKYKPIK